MYELIKINDKNYYIKSPAKIGIYLQDENNVYLIDSGNDRDAGRKIKKILEENGWNLKGILNTHSNADHIGGNQYLQRQIGCKIFSDKIEAAFTEYPILEPSFLYGGYPCKDLRHKFLMAKESTTYDFEDADFPGDIEVVRLPGHFFDMVGFLTPDGVFYIADSLSSRETIDKYRIGFIYSIDEYLKTLEELKNFKANIFVPSHADVTTDIGELAQYNIDKVNEIADEIVDICREPQNFESVLQKIFKKNGLKMTFEQYVLVGSTVKSYLSWLKDNNRVETIFEDSFLLWSSVN